MQAGIRMGGEGSEERLPATLRPMNWTIRSGTGRQWKVIDLYETTKIHASGYTHWCPAVKNGIG